MDKENYNFVSVRPLTTVNDFGSGIVNFSYGTHSNVCSSLQESYITMEFQLTGTTTLVVSSVDALTATNMGIASNPIGALINNLNLNLNGKPLLNVESVGVHTMHHQMLNYTKGMDVGNPIIPYSGGTTLNGPVAGARTNASMALRKRNESVIRGGDVGKVANMVDPHIRLSIPMKQFYDPLKKNEDFFGNLYYELSLNFNSSNYARDLLLTDTAIASAVLNSIRWNIPTYTCPVPASITYKREFYTTHTYKRSYLPNSSQYNVEANVVQVSVSFSHKETLARDNMPTAPQDLLTSIYINYNGRTYPSENYVFGTGSGDRDRMRAYQDYYHLSNAFRNDSDPLMNFQEWIHHPLYVFNVKSSENSTQQSILTLFTTGDLSTENHNTNLVAVRKKVVSVEHDASGAVVEVLVEETT